ncbi:MAG: calcium-binding protein [Alphaproteobacteria bacterium]|nr:calcium-binding protein [Alphaproteobacteria bacterium]
MKEILLMSGTPGDDFLIVGDGNGQFVNGEAGNDTLVGGGGNTQLLRGGDDADSLQGGNGSSQDLDGDAGNDTLVAGGGHGQRLFGHADADSLQGGSSQFQYLYGDDGNDTLVAGGGSAQELHGGDGDDSLQGGNYISQSSYDPAQFLNGLAGNDTLVGGGGNDQILRGGDGDDSLQGGNGVGQYLYGDAGNDTLVGGLGNNTLIGGNGTDWASYAPGTGAVTVDLGAGTSSDGSGNDSLTGIENALGGNGDDSILGDGLANVLDGGAGNDTLDGGLGNDTLIGGAGNDILDPGTAASGGADLVLGGDGTDTLVLAARPADYSFTTSGASFFVSSAAGVNVEVDGVERVAFGVTALELAAGATPLTVVDFGALYPGSSSDGVGVPPLAFSDTISAAGGTTQVLIDLRDIRFNDYDPDGGVQALVGFNTITPAGVSTTALLTALDVDAAGFDGALYPFGLLVVDLTSPLTAPIKLQYRSVLEDQAFGTSDVSSEATITINPVHAVNDRIIGSFGAETFIPYATLLANDGPGAVFGGISNAYIFGGSIVDNPVRGGIVIDYPGLSPNPAFFQYSLAGFPGSASVDVQLTNSPPITTPIARVVTPGTSFFLSFDDIRYKPGNFDPDGGSEPLVNVSGAASLGVTYSLSANGIDFTFPSTYSGGFSLEYTLTDQPLLARSLPGTITFLTAAPPAPVTMNEVLNWGINSDGRTIFEGGFRGFGQIFARELLANDTVMPGTIVVTSINDTTPGTANLAIQAIQYAIPPFNGVTSRSDTAFGFEFKDNFIGSDTYQYTIFDPLGRSATGLITLNVNIPQPVLTNNVILVPIGAASVTVSAAEILGNDAFFGTGAIAEILPNAVITNNDSGVSIGGGYTRINGFTLTFDPARTLDSYEFYVRTFDTAAAGGSASGLQKVTFQQGSSGSSGPTEGNDTLIGTEGADTIDALGGDDSVLGLGGNNSLLGSNGNDTLVAGGSNGQQVFGGNDADSLLGGTNNDYLDGGAGNDTLSGGAGNDTLDGGNGTDWLSYADATGSVTVDLGAGRSSGADGDDSLIGIENIRGGNFADSLLGGNGADLILVGDDGNDTLVAGGGVNQALSGGNDADSLQGGNGVGQVLYGDTGNDTLVAGGGNDQALFGGADADSLLGGTNNDYLDGGAGNDTLSGGAGNDTLIAGNGTDSLLGGADADSLLGGNGVYQRLSGGAGNDTADSLQGGNGEFQNLAGDAGNDTLVAGVGNNQQLYGGDDADSLLGGTNNDYLDGSAGSDTLNGGDGNDTLDGGNGTDWLSYADATGAVTVDLGAGTNAGAAGNDTFTGFEAVRGSASSDSILGSTDNDNIIGGLGNDTLVGGAGTSDYVLYVNATGSVTVDLLNRVSFGADGNDSLVGFEAVLGGAGNDSLLGDAGNNTLSGGAGDDTLNGGAGNDAVTGGSGNDLYFVNDTSDQIIELTGGGADTVISSVSISMPEQVEALQIAAGVTGITLTGGEGNDMLIGNGLANTFVGGAGDDVILAGNVTLADIYALFGP